MGSITRSLGVNAGQKNMESATLASCVAPCRANLLRFSQNSTLGFVVPASKALKKLTGHFGILRTAVLAAARAAADTQLLAAAEMPIALDVGAAAYGHKHWADGSDSLLLLEQFQHVSGAQIHAFEMQPDLAEKLGQVARRQQARQRSTTMFKVYKYGLSDVPSTGHAVTSMAGATVRNTFSLGGGVTKQSARVVLSVNVSTVDLWAHSQALRRPILYVKVDVEGGEPKVLAGMQALLRSPHAPIFMSFECARPAPLALASRRSSPSRGDAAPWWRRPVVWRRSGAAPRPAPPHCPGPGAVRAGTRGRGRRSSPCSTRAGCAAGAAPAPSRAPSRGSNRWASRRYGASWPT